MISDLLTDLEELLGVPLLVPAQEWAEGELEGDPLRTLTAARAAVEKHPRAAWSHAFLAVALIQANRWEEAADVLENASRQVPATLAAFAHLFPLQLEMEHAVRLCDIGHFELVWGAALAHASEGDARLGCVLARAGLRPGIREAWLPDPGWIGALLLDAVIQGAPDEASRTLNALDLWESGLFVPEAEAGPWAFEAWPEIRALLRVAERLPAPVSSRMARAVLDRDLVGFARAMDVIGRFELSPGALRETADLLEREAPILFEAFGHFLGERPVHPPDPNAMRYAAVRDEPKRPLPPRPLRYWIPYAVGGAAILGLLAMVGAVTRRTPEETRYFLMGPVAYGRAVCGVFEREGHGDACDAISECARAIEVRDCVSSELALDEVERQLSGVRPRDAAYLREWLSGLRQRRSRWCELEPVR